MKSNQANSFQGQDIILENDSDEKTKLLPGSQEQKT